MRHVVVKPVVTQILMLIINEANVVRRMCYNEDAAKIDYTLWDISDRNANWL